MSFRFRQTITSFVFLLAFFFFAFKFPAISSATTTTDPLGLTCSDDNIINAITATFNLSEDTANYLRGDVQPWYDQSGCAFQERVFNPENPNEIFGERYTYAQVGWIIHSLRLHGLNLFASEESLNVTREVMAQGVPPTTDQLARMGALGAFLGSLDFVYTNPPASAVESVKSTLAKFDLATPVSAQGYGYNSLFAIQNLWSASRNTAYMLLVLLLIASGFMVIFRVKINPQTVVSIQTLIPKLIITMVLIAFSYAISGLVIDLVYFFVSFVVAALSVNGGIVGNLDRAVNFATGSSLITMFLYYLIMFVVVFVGTIGTLTGPIISLVMFIAIVFLLFKIWWMLMKNYITFLLLVIIGPWQIMMGILPGNGGFGSWFRNLIAHAAVFAVIPIMFLFNLYIWQVPHLIGLAIAALNWTFTGGLSVATGISAATHPLPTFPFFGSQGMLFSIGLGYAVLAMIPKIADVIRDAIKAPAFKYGNAIGQAVGPVTNPVGGYFTGLGTRMERVDGENRQLTHLGGSLIKGIGGAIQGASR